MDQYLYLEIPLLFPVDLDPEEESDEEWEFKVKDYLEDVKSYVNC